MNVLILLLQATALLAPPGTGEVDLCAHMSGAGFSGAPPAFAAVAEATEKDDFKGASKEFLRALKKFSIDAEQLFFNGGRTDLKKVARFYERYSVCRGKGAGVKCKPGAVARRDVLSLRPDLLRWGAYLACRAEDNEGAVILLKTAWRDWADKDSREDAARLLGTEN